LGACAIGIPSLPECRAEIPLLAQRALQKCAEKTRLDGPTRFTDKALAVLCEGQYDGNVRQLEGSVLCAYLMARSDGSAEIDVEHLPPDLVPV